MATTTPFPSYPSYQYSSPLRNNPCEPCRARKRKCDYAQPVCARCTKTGKECVYVRNLKPEDQAEDLFVREDETASSPEDVAEMRRKLQAVESEILALRKARRSSKSPPDSSTSREVALKRDDASILPLKLIESMFNSPELLKKLGWKVTFAQPGIQIQTNVHNFQDLLDFFTTALRTVVVNEPLHPLATVHDNENSMTIVKTDVLAKFKGKLVDTMLKGFQNDSRDIDTIVYPPIVAGLNNLSIAKAFMDTVLGVYFTEFYQYIPLVHRSVVPLLYNNSDPMSSPALCAFAANILRWCQDTKIISTSLANYIETPSVGIYLFRHAQNMLNDSIFDEPNLNSFVALSLCNNWAMITMQVKKAWHLRGLAFRMAPVLIQTRYRSFSSPPSSSQRQYHTTSFPPSRAEWETFKRIFWTNIPIEIGLRDMRVVDATVADHVLTSLRTELGLPEPLDDEHGLTRRAILAIAVILKSLEISLPAFGDARVSVSEVVDAERAVRSWYNGIPAEFRMVTYDQLQLEDLAGVATADIDHLNLYVSLQYHGTMIRIHEQFLPTFNEGEASSSDASASPISPAAQYSHDICTRCARVVTAVFENLSRGFTTHFFMPTLLKACDVHYRNTHSSDPVIRKRAERDLVVTLGLSKKTRKDVPQHKFAEVMATGVDHAVQELGMPNVVEIKEPGVEGII